jgi:hypothetical protein
VIQSPSKNALREYPATLQELSSFHLINVNNILTCLYLQRCEFVTEPTIETLYLKLCIQLLHLIKAF